MKYLKLFELNTQNKPMYSADNLLPFINWFVDNFDDKMDKEGWLISYAQQINVPEEYKTEYYNKNSDFWQIQKNDEANILESDLDAEKLAKKAGLYIDDYGIVIGYNGVSFLQHPEEIEFYSDLGKYNI